MDYTVRAMAHQDGPAMRLLDEMSPDSGALSTVSRCLFDPYEVTKALYPDSVGVVVENPSDQSLVGMGFVQLQTVRFAGTLKPLGRLFGLVVHPEHRRRGLATTIYHKLMAQARMLQGPDTTFLAVIQGTNQASLRAAKTWATQMVEGRVRPLFSRTTNRAPSTRGGLTIRPAAPEDWDALAEGSNAFHAGAEWAPIITPSSLREFHERTPFGFPLQAYLVALESDGRIVAGLSVVFDGLVEAGLYPELPLGWQVLNLFRRFAPSGGVLKKLSIRDLWYAPGAEQAALQLWKQVGWLMRDKGNRLIAAIDPRSPLAAVLPKSTYSPEEGGLLAVAADRPLDLSKTLYLPF